MFVKMLISLLGKSLRKLGGFLLIFIGGFLKGKNYVENKNLEAENEELKDNIGKSDSDLADELYKRASDKDKD